MFIRPNFGMLLIPFFSIFMMHIATASEGDNLKKESKRYSSSATMNMEVIDNNGRVDFTDVVTEDDPNLDFNLKELPIGDYTLVVSMGDEIINFTNIRNVSKDQNVLTIEVINQDGEKVYGSTDAHETFDLKSMPKGKYLLKVYKGSQLINTNKLVN